jgi:pimeloyl-ACP methyl ester carboxylesterase
MLAEQRYDVRGVETAVLTAGDGPPLVFLHGGGTATGFDALLPLARRFRLIVPHRPGFGASADDPDAEGMEVAVLRCLDLLDALQLDRIALVGHSVGGLLAAKVAIVQPGRASALVLVAPLGLLVPDHPTVDILTVPLEDVPGYLSADPSVFAGLPSPPTPEFLTGRDREMRSLARMTGGHMVDRALPRWLGRIATPTLLLWGDADRLIPAGQAPFWQRHIPASRVHVVPGAGHLLFDEQSEAATGAIVEFVSTEA